MFGKKYILVNPEKYNASFKQSMTTGKIFFEFTVKAQCERELFQTAKRVLEGLTKIANEYNVGHGKEKTKGGSIPPASTTKGLK